MITKFHGLFMFITWINVCSGRHVQNLTCPEQYDRCPCENWKNNENGAVKRCSELLHISCVLDKSCRIANTLCINCLEDRNNLCKECCCKRTLRNSNLSHSVQRRQAGDQTVCPKPIDPENGKAIYEATVFAVGEAVKYRCREDFTMIGSATRHCTSNGKWAGELPTCEKLCSFPTINNPDGLSYVENPGRKDNLLDTQGNVVLSEIEFKCDSGFHLIGHARARCLSGGRWDRDPPRCEKLGQTKAKCPSPGLLENGNYDSQQRTTHFAGSIVTFKCNAGFRLSGSSVVVCTDSGTWSSQIPTCLHSEPSSITSPSTVKDPRVTRCQKPPEPKHGTLSFKIPSGSDSSGNSLDVKTSVEYRCNRPYILGGQPEQVCLATGQWSGSTPKCIPVCGKGVEPKSPQIVNGSSAKQNGYPWQVALTTYGSQPEIRYIHCGGVVITERWVLTAAHCITSERSRNLLPRNVFLLQFGKHFVNMNIDNNDVIYRKVSDLILHPEYDPRNFDSDLGLVLLESELVFNDAITPLCLPSLRSNVTFQDGLTGVVTGWGNIDNKGNASKVLMMLELPIVNKKKCEESYIRHHFKNTMTENMFCAGVDEGGKNTCQGDSGGAMAFYQGDQYVMEGIVSWGNKDDCAAAGSYSGYVRVRNFVPWILNYIGAHAWFFPSRH